MGGTRVHGGPQVVSKQASQGIDPEVDCQGMRGPQGPHPHALPYFSSAVVTAPYLVDYHDDHICLRVCIAIETFHHRRFISPLVRDVKLMPVDPAM